MTDWRRQLGMVPRDIRDRVPKHMQWQLNEHMARLALERGPGQRRSMLGLRWPRQIGRFRINGLVRVVFFLGWIAAVVGFVWTFLTLAPRIGIPPSVAPLVLFGLWCIVFMALHSSANAQASDTEKLAWKALNRIGIRTCEDCGYDCKAIDADRCPECGGELPDINDTPKQTASEANRPTAAPSGT